MSERFKNFKLALAGGVVITSAAVAGASVECGRDDDRGDLPTAVVRTYTPESSKTIELTKTPDIIEPEITVSDIDRSNYLKAFETDDYSYREKDVLRQPTDDPSSFVRIYDVLRGGVTRHGVYVEKIDREGRVVEEIRSVDQFVKDVDGVSTKEEALGVIFLTDQRAEKYFDPEISTSDDKFTVGVLMLADSECKLGKYEVDERGEIIELATHIGKIAEGECEK